MRMSDWSSDVCSSDLLEAHRGSARLPRPQDLGRRPRLTARRGCRGSHAPAAWRGCLFRGSVAAKCSYIKTRRTLHPTKFGFLFPLLVEARIPEKNGRTTVLNPINKAQP